ncbi:MAG: hypothetical protein RI580_16875 [Halothece sp. Uz-M2-17]|nr:hypothetical protein [Halothece sp. Uz-M2-17]
MTQRSLCYMIAVVWGAKGKQEGSRDETREVADSFSVIWVKQSSAMI